MKYGRFFIVISAICIMTLPGAALAEEYDEDVKDELIRQMDGVDVASFEEYLDDVSELTGEDIAEMDEMILELSERGLSGGAEGIFGSVKAILITELKKAAAPTAALSAAALITVLAHAVSDEGVKRVLVIILGLSSITVCTGAMTVLAGKAYEVLNETEALTDKTVPVMSALTAISGSDVFTPMLLFLSGTVLKIIKRLVMPLAVAEGVIAIADVLSERMSLEGVLKLIKKTVKWILGLTAVFFTGAVSIGGITGSVRNGVMLKTSKYALDRLVPSANGMISGTVDTVLGCAALLRNGTGTAVIIILVARIIRPLFALFSGMMIFRASAALISPVADKRIVRLYGNAADLASNMFTCAAVSGAMLIMTMFTALASSGSALGIL